MDSQAIQNLATIMNGFEEMERRENATMSLMCKDVVELIQRLDHLNTTIECVEPYRGSLLTADAFLHSLYHERDQLIARFKTYAPSWLADLTRSNGEIQNNHYPKIKIESRTLKNGDKSINQV